jgi:uncharacterized protein involved in type VI secretion and phage assembly
MPITLSPVVRLDGELLPGAWLEALVEVIVDRGFQVPGECRLRFVDSGYALLASGRVKLGASVVVSAPGAGDLITSEVTGVAVDGPVGGQPELILTAHDRSHRLGRETRVETYLQMRYSDVVAKLAASAGLQAQTQSSGLRLDYMLQVDSDLALVTEMAQRAGFDWWVDGKTLHFSAPAAGAAVVRLRLHEELQSFSVRATGHRPGTVQVDGWDRKGQSVVSASAKDSGATLVATSRLAELVASPDKAFGGATLRAAGLAAASNDEATELSNALRDRLHAAAVTARGVADGTDKIAPGAAVEVADAGPLSGTYYVSRVTHTYRPGQGFETRFVAGERRPTGLVDTVGRSAAPGATGRATHHPGLVVGEVTNINDPERQGRVKVRYPGLSQKDESAWARLLAVGGGKSRGTVFIPEVGDEVLVAFEGGDPRQPVVLGGLYGDKDTIPDWTVTNGKVAARRFTSRLGHKLELSDGDQPSEQHVLIALAGEAHKLRLGKDRVDLEVPSGVPVSVKSGTSSIVIGADGSIKIEGTNISIKATANLTLEGVQVGMKASAQATVESSGQLALKGTMTDIQGSAVVGVKGAMVQIN